jgi:hypothetical protein
VVMQPTVRLLSQSCEYIYDCEFGGPTGLSASWAHRARREKYVDEGLSEAL